MLPPSADPAPDFPQTAPIESSSKHNEMRSKEFFEINESESIINRISVSKVSNAKFTAYDFPGGVIDSTFHGMPVEFFSDIPLQ